ncbi:hypothetical protein F183_A37980 [Bryobacterales bacterium F-183]|nr:hypothetical protein F183_A37980 [Bryobacterales bacterium F-183]
MYRSVLLLSLICFVTFAQQEREKQVHRCHVYAVDEVGAAKLMEEIEAAPSGTNMETFRERASKIELILGRFEPEIGEEIDTVKIYPLGNTGMTVSAEVRYTDESMPGGDSMILSLAVAKDPVPHPRVHVGAALAEVSLDEFTYKARVKQRHSIGGKVWFIGLECECMSAEQRDRLWKRQKR